MQAVIVEVIQLFVNQVFFFSSVASGLAVVDKQEKTGKRCIFTCLCLLVSLLLSRFRSNVY